MQKTMTKINPHDYLDGTSPTQRGNENRLKVVDWLYRWGYSTAPVLQKLLNKKATGHAAAMAKSGWLVQTKTRGGGHNGTPKYFYTLSESGLQLAERTTQIPSLHRYPEIDPYRINQDLIRHYILAQTATIKALATGIATDYQTERMIDSGGDQLGVKRPDVVWIKDKRRTGIEVELSAKWDRKLDQFISGIKDALDQGTKEEPKQSLYQGFMVMTDSPAIAKRYREALTQPIQQWRKDKLSNKWVTQKDDQKKDIKLHPPAWLAKKVVIDLIEGKQ